MTYSPSTPGTSRDRLRFLIADTGALTSKPEVFTDDELDMVLDEVGGGIYDAAVLCYHALAAGTARHAIHWKVLAQDLEIDKRSIPQHFRMLADKMAERAAISGTAGDYISWSDQNVEEMLEGLHQAGFYDFQRWEETDT